MTGFDRPESKVLSLRGDPIGWVLRTPAGSGYVAHDLDRRPVSGEVHPTIDRAARELRLLRLAALPPKPEPGAVRALSPRSRGLLRLKTERPENRPPRPPNVDRLPYRD